MASRRIAAAAGAAAAVILAVLLTAANGQPLAANYDPAYPMTAADRMAAMAAVPVVAPSAYAAAAPPPMSAADSVAAMDEAYAATAAAPMSAADRIAAMNDAVLAAQEPLDPAVAPADPTMRPSMAAQPAISPPRQQRLPAPAMAAVEEEPAADATMAAMDAEPAPLPSATATQAKKTPTPKAPAPAMAAADDNATAAAMPLPGAVAADSPAAAMDDPTMPQEDGDAAAAVVDATGDESSSSTTTTATQEKAPVVAVSCPALPAAPAGTRVFRLTAAPAAAADLAATQSLAYNGTAVGPLIRVKRGDTVQVDVTNDGVSGGTTVHWHGLDLPDAAWADGVAGVTQRPIPDGATFSYRFKAEPAGTFWYHSHTGGQFADGLRGPLVVDDGEGGRDDPNASLYDEDLDEHVLVLADVFRTTAEEQLAELQRGGMGGAAEGAGVGAAESMMGMPADPASPAGKMAALCDPEVLNQDISDAPWYGVQVNGEGVISSSGEGDAATIGGMDKKKNNGTAATATSGRPHVITVERGKRYRMRLIGGMSSWALKVNFTGGHAFDLIALDGRPLEAKRARALVLTSGERADVVLEADRPVGNYWVDISTLDGRNSPAILHYKGAPDPFGPKGANFTRTMRARLPEGCRSALGGQPGLLDFKNATGLAPAAGVPAPPAGAADKAFTIYLADASSSVPPPSFLKHIRDNSTNIHGFSLRDGNIPAKGPACPPLEGGSGKNDTSKYCWSLNWNVYEPPLDGTPLIFGSPSPSRPAPRSYNIDVDQGDVVDLVLINPSLMVHPMHLHGTGFYVLAQGNGLIVDGKDQLVPGKAKLNLRNAVLRDTVPVAQAAPAMPGGEGMTELDPASYGYAVIRFKADNPGPWAFHCHIELHSGSGMFLTFTVHPKKEEPPPPPRRRSRRSLQQQLPAAGPAVSAISPPKSLPSVEAMAPMDRMAAMDDALMTTPPAAAAPAAAAAAAAAAPKKPAAAPAKPAPAKPAMAEEEGMPRMVAPPARGAAMGASKAAALNATMDPAMAEEEPATTAEAPLPGAVDASSSSSSAPPPSARSSSPPPWVVPENLDCAADFVPSSSPAPAASSATALPRAPAVAALVVAAAAAAALGF
jgi:FtsP/CotA-like multicopper oxidase with cupredoxin domain